MRGSDVYFGDVDRERHEQASPAPGSVPFRWPSSVCAPRALQIGFYVGSLRGRTVWAKNERDTPPSSH